MACREIFCGQTSPEYIQHTALRVFYLNMYHLNKVKQRPKKKKKLELCLELLGLRHWRFSLSLRVRNSIKMTVGTA